MDFASDASALLSHGEAAQVGCIGIPTENTHGFEIVLEEGIEACRRTLVEFLDATAGRRSLTDNRSKENSMNEYLPTSTANGLPHNLQRGERLASIGAGLVLAGFGLARGGLPGACKAVAGGLLVSRGLSGHCHVKGLLNEPREELQLLREEVQHLTRRLQRLQERQRDDSRQDAALDAELPPNLP